MDSPTMELETSKTKSHGHSTNLMALSVAEQLNAQMLILTHFSNKYSFLDEEDIISGCLVHTKARVPVIKCARDFSEFYICSK